MKIKLLPRSPPFSQNKLRHPKRTMGETKKRKKIARHPAEISTPSKEKSTPNFNTRGRLRYLKLGGGLACASHRTVVGSPAATSKVCDRLRVVRWGALLPAGSGTPTCAASTTRFLGSRGHTWSHFECRIGFAQRSLPNLRRDPRLVNSYSS